MLLAIISHALFTPIPLVLLPLALFTPIPLALLALIPLPLLRHLHLVPVLLRLLGRTHQTDSAPLEPRLQSRQRPQSPAHLHHQEELGLCTMQ